MQQSDIKHTLKMIKEYEGIGSFVMGVGVVSIIFLGSLFGLEKLKFRPFEFMKRGNKEQAAVVTPTSQPKELAALPTTPNLYEKDGQWFVQGLPATYTVQNGDSSWKVAMAVYGAGENYRDIESENNMKTNQDLVVGQKITLPNVPSKKVFAVSATPLPVTTVVPTSTATPIPTASVQPTAIPTATVTVKKEGEVTLPTKHVVQKSEGLWQIAQKYYKDGYKYMKIYEANRDKMKSPEDINPGMELTIPQL